MGGKEETSDPYTGAVGGTRGFFHGLTHLTLSSLFFHHLAFEVGPHSTIPTPFPPCVLYHLLSSVPPFSFSAPLPSPVNRFVVAIIIFQVRYTSFGTSKKSTKTRAQQTFVLVRFPLRFACHPHHCLLPFLLFLLYLHVCCPPFLPASPCMPFCSSCGCPRLCVCGFVIL